MKLSKTCKYRIRLMTNPERKSLVKSARLLAEAECITMERCLAIVKWCNKGGY